MKHGKLPHANLQDHYQFITFRTLDSLDLFLSKIAQEKISNRKKQLLIDQHLDSSSKGAYLWGEAIDIFRDAVLRDDKGYEIVAMAIMPNHIHLLIKQKTNLSDIVKHIKGKSAIDLNRNLRKSGQFWSKDYYDRAIRNEEHFEQVYRYILNNPIKAALPDAPRRVYSIYET